MGINWIYNLLIRGKLECYDLSYYIIIIYRFTHVTSFFLYTVEVLLHISRNQTAVRIPLNCIKIYVKSLKMLKCRLYFSRLFLLLCKRATTRQSIALQSSRVLIVLYSSPILNVLIVLSVIVPNLLDWILSAKSFWKFQKENFLLISLGS